MLTFIQTWKQYTEMMTQRRKTRRINKQRAIWLRWRQFVMVNSRVVPVDTETIGISSALLQDVLEIKEEERKRVR